MKELINRNFLSFWTDKDKRIQAAHLLDLCENTMQDQERAVTPFLSPGMTCWFRNVLQGTGLRFLSWGGFEDAERVRFVLDGSAEEPGLEQAGISLIQAIPLKKDLILEHRDILGSLIGLGLERERIGDIRQAARGSVVAASTQIQDYIFNNWDSVGREKIQVAPFDFAENYILPLAGLEKRIVTASSRLDAVAAAGFGVSRSMVQEYIRQGKVKKNDAITLKPEVEVREEDIISCRGQGRLKILEEDSRTRKGRLAWRIFIFKNTK